MDHSHIHADGPWTFIEGLHEGHPMTVRLNTSLREVIAHPDYPLQVGITVPMHLPRENGMPGADESADLKKIEDELYLALLPKNESLFALVITTNGMREFVFYTSNDGAVREKVNDIRDQIFTHTIQLMIRPDPSWKVYRTFALSS